MNQNQSTNTKGKDPLQVMADNWVEAVHSGQVIDQAGIDQFHKLLTDVDGYIDFYNSEWSGFNQLDEFPFNAISLQKCIDNCEDLEDEEILWAFRWVMEEYEYICFFLREIISTDGRSAWILVNSISMGQAGIEEKIAGVFTTPLATEMYLRANGYFFIADTPSGKIDSFTDEQIYEIVRKADK
jgi:hypothetical protein